MITPVEFMRRFCIPLILVAFGCQASQATPSVGQAGANASAGAFAIPTSRLVCGPYALPRSAPPGLLGYQFEDARLTAAERVMQVGYDPTGRPVMLVVTAAERMADGRPETHVLSVWFTRDPATGFRVLHPAERNDTTIEPLSAAAVAQARTLATWLWNHRCNLR